MNEKIVPFLSKGLRKKIEERLKNEGARDGVDLILEALLEL